jgi:hypothetical protein
VTRKYIKRLPAFLVDLGSPPSGKRSQIVIVKSNRLQILPTAIVDHMDTMELQHLGGSPLSHRPMQRTVVLLLASLRRSAFSRRASHPVQALFSSKCPSLGTGRTSWPDLRAPRPHDLFIGGQKIKMSCQIRKSHAPEVVTAV